LLAAAGGVGLAVLFNQSRLIEYSLYPYAVTLQVTPIVAIAPLLLIYLPQQAAVLACAWIVAFFPVLANTTLGLRSVDHNLADLFRLYGATRRQVLWELKLPAALPYILGGLKIAGGLSLIGAVVAEIAAGSARAGAELPGQAHPHPGALCPGRHLRHRLAHPRRQADGSLGPASAGGESARRQWFHRHGGGGKGRARRLHHGHGNRRGRGDQS